MSSFKLKKYVITNIYRAIRLSLILILIDISLSAQSSGNITDISFKNEQTIILSGENGLIMRSDNSGASWSDISANITNVIYTCAFAEYPESHNSFSLIMAAGENGIILRSSDAGNTWNFSSGINMNDLHDILIYDQNNYYICGNNGTILHSTDHGDSWNEVSLKTSMNLKKLVSLPPGSSRVINIISAGENGTCYATINMTDWFAVTMPVQEDILSIASKGNTVICGTENGKILRSVNRGVTWEAVSTGITTEIFCLEFTGETDLTGTTSSGLILRSTNNGLNWVIINTSVSHNLTGLGFGSSTFGIAGGLTDSLLYTTNGGISWNTFTEPYAILKSKEDHNTSLKNYPNPFNPVTTINYSLKSSGNVILTVYDIAGKQVDCLVNKIQNKGEHSVKFDANNLASGIYFYTLIFNDGIKKYTETKKMILTK